MMTLRKSNRRLGFLAYQRDLDGFVNRKEDGLVTFLDEAAIFPSPEAAVGAYRRVRGDDELEAFQVLPLFEEIRLRAGYA